ncbi:MAG: hypothetical protein RJA83_833 [Pseudomonadota bacterium]
MNLNFSNGNNKCTDRSLQDGIEIVSAGLASVKKATDRIMARSASPAFREAHDLLGTISENIEAAGSELTTKQTFNCRR